MASEKRVEVTIKFRYTPISEADENLSAINADEISPYDLLNLAMDLKCEVVTSAELVTVVKTGIPGEVSLGGPKG